MFNGQYAFTNINIDSWVQGKFHLNTEWLTMSKAQWMLFLCEQYGEVINVVPCRLWLAEHCEGAKLALHKHLWKQQKYFYAQTTPEHIIYIYEHIYMYIHVG